MMFAVMITSRNRCDDLRHTLGIVQSLCPQPSEIWVCADGCVDGTPEMVATDFPHVNLITNKIGEGSIPSRDRMLRLSLADWVLSLDDDSYPLDKDFFAKAKQLIKGHPDVSVFTFPELRNAGVYPSSTKTPCTPGHYVSAYPNCAALMKRSDYILVGGYPVFFVHNYEEPDYALQLAEYGKAVWFEPSLIIRHHFSTKNRSYFGTHHLNARNELWSVWIRCPLPWLPAVTAFRMLRQFQYAYREGLSWALREPLWWWAAMRGINDCLKCRRPILWKDYLRWMKLARKSADISGKN